MPGNSRPWVITPGIRVALPRQHPRHDLAHVDRHLHPVAAVAHAVENTVVLAGVGKPILGHVDNTPPAIIDARSRELGKQRREARAQDLTATRILQRVGHGKPGATSKHQPMIRCKAKIVMQVGGRRVRSPS